LPCSYLRNTSEAVAPLSNTDGGVILAGVKDKDATGEDRIVGVPKSEHDAVASNLHALIPEAMPEIIPAAMPTSRGSSSSSGWMPTPSPTRVTVSGKVLYRMTGRSVPADRRRVLDLVGKGNRDEFVMDLDGVPDQQAAERHPRCAGLMPSAEPVQHNSGYSHHETDYELVARPLPEARLLGMSNINDQYPRAECPCQRTGTQVHGDGARTGDTFGRHHDGPHLLGEPAKVARGRNRLAVARDLQIADLGHSKCDLPDTAGATPVGSPSRDSSWCLSPQDTI
jgi:hypothetical protein